MARTGSKAKEMLASKSLLRESVRDSASRHPISVWRWRRFQCAAPTLSATSSSAMFRHGGRLRLPPGWAEI